MLTSACAVSYETNNGERHIFGTGKVEIAAATKSTPSINGNAITLSNFGVTITQSVDRTDIALGYVKTTWGKLRNCEPTNPERLPVLCTKPSVTALKPKAFQSATSLSDFWSKLPFVSISTNTKNIAGSAYIAETAGIGLSTSMGQNTLTVGYAKDELVSLVNHSLVSGNPICDLRKLSIRGVNCRDK